MAERVLHDIKVMGLIPVWVHYWWIQIFGVYKFYMANWMVVTRILHTSCKIVSEYPKYELCQLYNFVHCKKKYRPEKMVRKDVSAVEGTTLKNISSQKKIVVFQTVLRADPHIGLLHRGTEKLIEYKTYLQVYMSPVSPVFLTISRYYSWGIRIQTD